MALPGQPAAPVADPVPQKDRAYRSRISAADRALIADKITAGWAAGNSVDHAFASAWDAGVMLRVAAVVVADRSRHRRPVRSARSRRPADGSKTPREAPVLEATGPGQVWSWDITDLRSPWRGIAFKAYSIIDIYSRKIVGWRVEEREVDDLAVEMFQHAFAAPRHATGRARRLRTSDALQRAQRPPRPTPASPRPTTGPECPTTTRSPNQSSAP